MLNVSRGPLYHVVRAHPPCMLYNFVPAKRMTLFCPRLHVVRTYVPDRQLLEKQLKKASAEERKMGIDLSGLRAQLKKEIAEVDRRL